MYYSDNSDNSLRNKVFELIIWQFGQKAVPLRPQNAKTLVHKPSKVLTAGTQALQNLLT